MAEVLEMLALSPTMEEGHLVTWHKNEGDPIEDGELLAEVETDKAKMDLESFFDGIVLKLLVPAGTNVRVGDPIAIIGEEGEDISGLLDGGSSSQAKDDVPAPEQQDTDDADTDDDDTDDAEPEEQTPAPQGDQDRIFSSPVARRIARDEGIELANIEGSGPRGRIVKRDVEAALEARTKAPAKAPKAAQKAPAAASLPPAPGPDLEALYGDAGERINLTPMRRTIAQRMTSAWTTAPHFALTTEIDMTELMTLRKTLNGQLKAADEALKLSVNDFIIKACARALRDVPEMNVAWGGDHLLQHESVHISIAVAIDGGLITPVLRDADARTLGNISSTVRELATRARDKRLKPEEYQGGTFSISNLGMFGITQFMAVLNPPEAGILAVGAVVQKPVVVDGEVTVRHRMNVTLSCDHRSTDGAVGARLLQAITRYLENPVLLTV